MTLVDYIDLDYDEYYVKLDVIDLTTDEDTSKGSTRYCKNHDSASKGCMVQGCTNVAHGGTPLCICHGSRMHKKRGCAVSGCTKGACSGSQGRTDRCVKHGGGKRCKYDGCGKGAQGNTDFCIAHGGGRRCKFQGCGKSAQGRTDYCIKHGGGRRCMVLGCNMSAAYGTDFCSMHRTSLLSGYNSAHEMLPAPAPECRAKEAEPSKRRNSHSVTGGERAQKRQNTDEYVNNIRSFSDVEMVEEKGRVLICQNNTLKAQQTAQEMKSESDLAA
ncbi:uncharacterized protein [Aegilops tauschii subsp. strangulata]|uniref:uncharacterized protein n=1 Tax=Aegilops tauschii subsp. strangulata TaxID=200361 RepID=UPI001ABC2D6A|nr:uncharacterized protein LOC109785078 [Aegilops tauschii subsp. strangulata]